MDKSCLKSKYDKSKSFTIKEIRGTELEKQFKGDITNLPDDMSVYLGDWSDLHGLTIHDKGIATFDDVFTNQFIYCFGSPFAHPFKLFDEKNFIRSKEYKDNATLCRQQLYDLVYFNTRPNEVVEIYAEWIKQKNIYDFGPPEETIKLNINQILTSELLDTKEKIKIEIHNMR